MKTKIPLQGSSSCKTIDLPEENRTGVLEIINPKEWCAAQCDLSLYKQQYVTIRFSADVKRVGAAGNLTWQVNSERYPSIGNSIKKAAADIWYKMSGEWTGVLTNSYPAFYLSTWKNKSDVTTYYIDNFNIDVAVNPEVKKPAAAQKSLSDVARYIKGLLPGEIPKKYPIKPMLKSISCEENIRNGVAAFRDFLNLFCDRLIADGSLYEKPKKENHDKSVSHPSMGASYPFLNNTKNVLVNIGYHSELNKNDDLLVLNKMEFLSDISTGEWKMKAKISGPKIIESLRFLASCGFNINGIDLDAQKANISKAETLKISYPDNPAVLTGLKVMATAHVKLQSRTTGDDDVFLRCDYRSLKSEETEILDYIRGYIRPLPVKAQEFVLKLHKRYIDAGLKCKVETGMVMRFTYFHKSKAVWELASSHDYGYCIFIKAINTHQYSDVIKEFSPVLQEKIVKGFGCEKKRFGEHCQKGCHGFRISLDDSVTALSRDIEIWIDSELSCLQKGK